ncbi:MAG TPA: protein-disulfide reductase DsbD N-terminal domain-containing protein [Pyrinomonadaceae bacterium]|nr:protein-disulfide reductase DsbD N-terminal domain-containing protein [Pyrinomonadaceae bacterium]
MRNRLLVSFLLLLVGLVASSQAQSPPNIRINNYLTSDSVKKGRSLRGVVEVDIPSGFHIHSNRPLESFLIATQLTIEGPKGVRVGRVTYPRAQLKNLKFSKNRVAVFEGRATIRFSVVVPASYSGDSVDLKGKLRYQSCSDELCFRPENREFNFSAKVQK